VPTETAAAPAESPPAQPVHVQVTATFEGVFDLLRRLTPVEGMSLTTAATLGRLDRHGEHRLSELACAEGVTQPAMTQLVSRLERDGLAERGSDPADGRVVLVRITEAGREAVRRRRSARLDRMAELLPALPAPDQEAIVAALPALDRLVAAARGQ
jgi:DNA-binding MarR family transcriptional regulator